MEEEKFEQWAIVELFGHQKIAGLVTNAQIGGATFIRVDVPKVEGKSNEFTRFYNPSAVYGINPVSEEIAKQMANRIDSKPVVAWDIPCNPQKKLPYGEDLFLEEDDHDN